MIPAGPRETFTDYHRFIENSQGLAEAHGACYKAEIKLCDVEPIITRESAVCPDNSPFDTTTKTCPQTSGVCGSSNGQEFSTAPTTNLCTSGTPTGVSGGTDSPWIWSCTSENGGTTASCSAPKAEKQCVAAEDFWISNPNLYAWDDIRVYWKLGATRTLDSRIDPAWTVWNNGPLALENDYFDLDWRDMSDEWFLKDVREDMGQYGYGDIRIENEPSATVVTDIKKAAEYYGSTFQLSGSSPSVSSKGEYGGNARDKSDHGFVRIYFADRIIRAREGLSITNVQGEGGRTYFDVASPAGEIQVYSSDHSNLIETHSVSEDSYTVTFSVEGEPIIRMRASGNRAGSGTDRESEPGTIWFKADWEADNTTASCSLPKTPPGTCGNSHQALVRSEMAITEQCSDGSTPAISFDAASKKFNWNCGSDSCYADWDKLPDETAPATPQCFFQVSGVMLNSKSLLGATDTIGAVDPRLHPIGNYVGPGEYEIAEPFAVAHSGSFDSLAIGPNVHAELFSEPNFLGDKIMDQSGPAFIYNNFHSGEFYQSDAFYDDIIRGVYDDDLDNGTSYLFLRKLQDLFGTSIFNEVQNIIDTLQSTSETIFRDDTNVRNLIAFNPYDVILPEPFETLFPQNVRGYSSDSKFNIHNNYRDNMHNWGAPGGPDKHIQASLRVTCEPKTAGQCGSNNGQELSEAPTDNLCTSGTPTAVTGSGPWNWSCTGQNSGTPASCSAEKEEPEYTWVKGSTVNYNYGVYGMLPKSACLQKCIDVDRQRTDITITNATVSSGACLCGYGEYYFSNSVPEEIVVINPLPNWDPVRMRYNNP